MTSKESKIATFQDKDISSKKRAVLAVQNKYNATKLLVNGNCSDNQEEQLKSMQSQQNESNDFLQSLDADDTLKTMLATQMAAIHDIQQREFLFAMQKSILPEKRQQHINAVTKLSNVFIQQISLMQKLQGKGQQKVTVEHVHVHEGGQAIVGNVETNSREG